LSLTLDPISSLVSGTHGAATVDGWRSTWNSTLNPASSRAGYYSVGIDLADSGDIGQPNIPQGSGYASFVVASAGTLTVAGKTADGSAISSAGFIGPKGEIAVYSSLYGNLGTVHGKWALSEDATGGFADNSIAGTLTWSKPPTTARAYKAAFGPINLNASGKYLAPAATGYVVLGLPDVGSASLGFTQGGIGAAAINPDIPLTYTATNTSVLPTFASGNNPAKTTLTINKSTGLVTGSFTLVDPAPTGTRVVSYSGMIVRPASGTAKARGYFLLPQIPIVGQTITTSPILSGMMQVTP
jgi:hypothetical protein